MDENLGDIIERVQAEHDVGAEEMLAALVAALVERHVDVELRRMGRREPYPIHNERVDALKAVNDAVHQKHHRAGAGSGGTAPDGDAALQAVMALLMLGQFAAEAAAGIGGDDDEDDGPRMRIVRD